jgi:low affinity Fe/Cu permease
MSERPAAPARHGENRGPFDRFVSRFEDWVSHPAAFAVVLAIVVVWFVSFPLWHDDHSWQIAIHTVSSVVALLLLVLLRNAARRAHEAQDEKLNVLAEGLAALMESRGAQDSELREAAGRLRDAVGLEQRH